METALQAYSETRLSQQARNDAQVVDMWLHGRPDTTQRAYRRAVKQLLDFARVAIREVTLGDLQDFADSLRGADSYRALTLSAVKSLLKFTHRLGYTQFDVGAALRLPKIKNRLAERILTEEQVMRIIALEPNHRNAVLLRLMYASGGRVSEVCGLTWKDTQSRSEAGQVTLYGKGGKTRVVLLSADTWKALESISDGTAADDAIFRSRKHGGHLDAAQVFRIVRTAAVRAGIAGNVSPHWFRHSHASHALDRNCPIHQVQATLGHASLTTTSRYVHARPTESSALYLLV